MCFLYLIVLQVFKRKRGDTWLETQGQERAYLSLTTTTFSHHEAAGKQQARNRKRGPGLQLAVQPLQVGQVLML